MHRLLSIAQIRPQRGQTLGPWRRHRSRQVAVTWIKCLDTDLWTGGVIHFPLEPPALEPTRRDPHGPDGTVIKTSVVISADVGPLHQGQVLFLIR